MIDFHSHIIYDVDDGVKNIEDSIKIIREAKKAGFTEIILTPHYMENYYECNCNIVKKKMKELQNEIDKENIGIKLYQANEIYITTNINKIIDENKACSINKSKYVLIELPMNEMPLNLLETLYIIKENKQIPIIAHPERYAYVQKKPEILKELVEEHNVLFQANYGSIIGQYGKKIEKTVKKLLKMGYIHFLGSDVHRKESIYLKIDKAQRKLNKILNDNKIKELTYVNPKKILNNEEINKNY